MKSKLARMLTLMLAALAAAAAIWGGCLLVSRNFLFWNGVLLARDAQSLTLTGRPMKNLDRLLELTQLERLDLRPYLDEDREFEPAADLPGAGEPTIQESIYYITAFDTEAMPEE